MLIIRLRGGLGNQMFQYAFYRSLVLSGKEVKCDVSAYEYDAKRNFALGLFPKINLDIIKKEEFEDISKKYQQRSLLVKIINKVFPKSDYYFTEKNEEAFYPELYKANNKILDGYFQNEKYFSENEKTIKSELQFPDLKSEKLKQLSEELLSEPSSVSIHIRRGDYLDLVDLYGGICTLDYYQRAIMYIESKVVEPKYYVMSDDIEWVKSNLKLTNATYIDSEMFEQYEDWYDMYIMHKCHHNIIANSSFSWWGAWLNEHDDKIVVRPKKWNQRSNMEGLCCKDWITV